MKRRHSLLWRVPFWVSLVIIVMGSLATFIVYYFSQQQLIENEKENIIIISEGQVAKTKEVFSHTQDISESLASEKFVIDYLSNNNPVEQDYDVLDKMKLYNIADSYSAIYIMDIEGKTLTSTNAAFVGNNYGFRDYFKVASTGNSFVDISVGVTSGELGYYFSSPVINEDQILGVVVMKISPESINRTLQLSDNGRIYNIMMVDEYGVIVSSIIKDKEFMSLGVLSPADKKEINDKERYGDIDIEPLEYSLIQNKLDITSETKVYELYDDYDQESEIVTVSQLGDYPFYILVEDHTNKLRREAANIGLLIGSMVFASAVAAAILILIILRESLKPMSAISEGLEKIGAGNYEYEIEIDTKDEFGNFSRIINKMSKRIMESRQGIEKKIEERTERLEKMNSLMVGREKKMIDLKKKLQDCKKEKE